MVPVYLALSARENISLRLVLTGQHRDMTRNVLDLFDVRADIDLDVMEHNQTLISLSKRITDGLECVIRSETPDTILVQGDTTSAMIGGFLGFYAGCRVGHVEAGLRTRNIAAPFPEEYNRRVISLGSHWHFAPTETAANNLVSEGIDRNVHVVGNTVIDAALQMAKKLTPGKMAIMERLPFLEESVRKTVLITVHRRENIGAPMMGIASAIRELAELNPAIDFVIPVHPNPAVGSILRPTLESTRNVHLINPLDYDQMIHILTRSYLVLTDSGGIQEEAPAFDVPVLVLRNESERMEGIAAGCSRLVGTNRTTIVAESQKVFTDPAAHAMMANSVNPYGQGLASEMISDILDNSI